MTHVCNNNMLLKQKQIQQPKQKQQQQLTVHLNKSRRNLLKPEQRFYLTHADFENKINL